MKPRHRPKDQAKARERLQEKEAENKVPDWIRVRANPEVRPICQIASHFGPSVMLDTLIGHWEPMPTDPQFRHDLYGPVVALLREAKAHYDKVAEEFLAIADKPPVPTEDTVMVTETYLANTKTTKLQR